MTAHLHQKPGTQRQDDASITVWPYLIRVALLLFMLAGTCWLQWAFWFVPRDNPDSVFFYVSLWERRTVTAMSTLCVCGSGLLVYLSHRRITRALNASRHPCARGEAQ